MSKVARAVFTMSADAVIEGFAAGDIDFNAARQILEIAEELAIHMALIEDGDLDSATLFGNGLMVEWDGKLSAIEAENAKAKM